MLLSYLDIPNVYRPSAEGFDFIQALGKCLDIGIFRNQTVQIIVDNHWAYWRNKYMYYIGLPMVVQLCAFWYWSNFVLINLKKSYDTFNTQDRILRMVLICTAIYLLLIETTVIIKLKWKYLSTATRLFNLITPVLIMTNIFTKERKAVSHVKNVGVV